MDLGQHNSHSVLVKMIEEWEYCLQQSEALWEEAIELTLHVPKAQAIGMRQSDMDEIRNTLYRIREENNHIKICINRELFIW